MSEPKPIATLSSSLLARKGHAKPAMRPQNYNFTHAELGHSLDSGTHEDLGWNDMGHDADPVPPTPIHANVVSEPVAPPPVVKQQESLARKFTSPALSVPKLVPAAAPSVPTRAAPGSKGKSAFTLRLDEARHLRLRLVCAVRHRSAQQVVTQALDEFLDRQKDVETLNAKR
jgi:hypothetical protein